MEAALTADQLIRIFSSRLRVVTLGGIAVISHGLSRNTYDTDIWIEPFEDPEIWAGKVGPLLFGRSRAVPVALGSWEPFAQQDLADVIGRDGMLRVNKLDRPLDIFRSPNELPVEEFDAVWERAEPLDDGTRLPDAVDLLMTKQSTGRDKDMMDILFLEAKAERHYLETLPNADPAMAAAMLERFLTPKVAEAALGHPGESVRGRATHYLKELADDGDPFALEILKKRS